MRRTIIYRVQPNEDQKTETFWVFAVTKRWQDKVLSELYIKTVLKQYVFYVEVGFFELLKIRMTGGWVKKYKEEVKKYYTRNQTPADKDLQ